MRHMRRPCCGAHTGRSLEQDFIGQLVQAPSREAPKMVLTKAGQILLNNRIFYVNERILGHQENLSLRTGDGVMVTDRKGYCARVKTIDTLEAHRWMQEFPGRQSFNRTRNRKLRAWPDLFTRLFHVEQSGLSTT